MAPDDRSPRTFEINADDLPRITETLLGQVEGPTYHLDALTLARAWLSVAQASGRDADVPLLHRTVALEAHRDDRGFQAGDEVLLREWDPARRSLLDSGAYTGRALTARIGYVLHSVPSAHGLQAGLNLGDWVVFSLVNVRDAP